MAAGGKAAAAYAQIERMIVMRDLTPGMLVSEALVMERTGLGRTPVREALQQLARHRMVEIHPSKGVLIPPISVEDQLRMLEMRRALEVLAVRLACARVGVAEEHEIRALASTLEHSDFSLQQYAETVKETHDLVARTAHNDYVASALAPVQVLSRRFWLAHVIDETAEVRSGRRLHLDILSAILRREPDAAQEASHALNDYLIDFAYAVLRRTHQVP